MYDGNITTEDEDAQLSAPMKRLFNWYHQAGTPQVNFSYEWNPALSQFTVECSQSNPRCVELIGVYDPVLIPIRIGLVDRDSKKTVHEAVLNFCELEQTFVIKGIVSDCVPSFMRDFSAPVTAQYDMNIEDRLFLMAHDSNMFNRWEQSQIIHKKNIVGLYDGDDSQLDSYVDVLVKILSDDTIDPSLKSSMVSLPLQEEMIICIPDCDPIRLYSVAARVDRELSVRCRDYLVGRSDGLLHSLPSVTYALTKEQMAEREFFRTLIRLRIAKFHEADATFIERVYNCAVTSDNLTNRVGCIAALASAEDPDGSRRLVLDKLLDYTAELYAHDSLMTSKWLRWVSTIPSSRTVRTVTDLFDGLHPRSAMVSKTTPNHLDSLVQAFTANPYVHEIMTTADGADHAPGYEYVTKCLLEIDPHNAIVSARIAGLFDNIKHLSPRHRGLMQKCIDRIKSVDSLSENVRELLH
jgi:aminopeptidase N